jgi:hypothetical protein
VSESSNKISAAMKRHKVDDSKNELYSRFRYQPVTGLGYEDGVNRRDPSTIIKADDKFYIWYTRNECKNSSWLDADIWYATSKDGINWQEQGPAVQRGEKGSWDEYSVFTTEILVANNQYYLCYQAKKNNDPLNVVGMAKASSPDGPWTKLPDPILECSQDGKLINPHEHGDSNWGAALEVGSWDSGAIHDPGIITFNGKYYLYYKGHAIGEKMFTDSKWGVAIADNPEGPYIKHEANPVSNSGHETWVFPWKTGIAAIVDWAGPEKGTIQYSENGIDFEIVTTLEDIPPAGGAYVADKFTDSGDGQGFSWGLAHYGASDWCFLVGFTCDLERNKEKDLGWHGFPHYSAIRDVMKEPERFGISRQNLFKNK